LTAAAGPPDTPTGFLLAVVLLTTLSLAGWCPSAAPASKVDYPQKGKPVTIIVPFPAGGSADIAARAHAAMLERDLGAPFMITNKGGAGGQVGNSAVALAKPDGYTLGWCPPASLIPSYVDPDRKSIFTRKSFQPIAVTARAPFSLIVWADSPYKTIRADPGNRGGGRARQQVPAGREDHGRIGGQAAQPGGHVPVPMEGDVTRIFKELGKL